VSDPGVRRGSWWYFDVLGQRVGIRDWWDTIRETSEIAVVTHFPGPLPSSPQLLRPAAALPTMPSIGADVLLAALPALAAVSAVFTIVQGNFLLDVTGPKINYVQLAVSTPVEKLEQVRAWVKQYGEKHDQPIAVVQRMVPDDDNGTLDLKVTDSTTGQTFVADEFGAATLPDYNTRAGFEQLRNSLTRN